MPSREQQLDLVDREREVGLQQIFSRLRDEFDLAILTIFGGISAIVVTGFAIYRFLSGSLPGGLIDSGIVLGLVAVVLYGWVGHNVARAGAIFVGFAVVACVASSIVFGSTASYWTFLVLSISFVVTGLRAALLGNLGLIAAIAVQESLFANAPERVIFTVTALLVTVFGWIFKERYDTQRLQLLTLATQDPLTHAGNRRLMRKELMEALAAKQAADTSAVLAVLDLDRFKNINDEYGHETGDKVLVRLVEIVQKRLRRTDGIYRLGGEEFVVLLNEADMAQARPVLDDLHRLFGEGMQEISMPITVSIGAAALREGESGANWLRRADDALYRAKQNGRDRVEVDTDEPSPQTRLDRRGSFSGA